MIIQLSTDAAEALNNSSPADSNAKTGTVLKEVQAIANTDASGVQGVILTDTVTGTIYRLTIESGEIDIEAGTLSGAGVWTPA